MKKILALSALLLVVSAPAFAQLNIAWNGCPGTGTAGVADVCAAPAVLYGTFEIGAIPDATGMDYVMDLQTSAAVLPDFWFRANGECNGGGANAITLFSFYFPGDPGCTVPTDLAGFFGGSVAASSASWGSGPNILAIPDNRGKLVGSILRTGPGALAAGEQFAGKWTVPNTNTGSCLGCDTPAAIVFNQMLLFTASSARSISPEAGTITLEGPGQHGNCASVAGGDAICGATPTQSRSWGQIKSLYR